MKSNIKKVLFTVILVISAMMIYTTVASANTTIKEDSIYYESSQKIGRSNRICNTNTYIDSTREVSVNLYSFIDSSSHIISYGTCKGLNDIPDIPLNTVQTMVHVNSSKHVLGWTEIENIIETIQTPKEQAKIVTKSDTKSDAKTDAKILANKIKEDTKIPQDSILLFDISGSMAKYIPEVINQLSKMYTTGTIKATYAFATYLSAPLDINKIDNKYIQVIQNVINSSSSDIAGAIYKCTTKYPNAHIYLLSDMLNNVQNMQTDDKFFGKLTIIQYKDGNSYYQSYTDDFYDSIKTCLKNAEFIELF